MNRIKRSEALKVAIIPDFLTNMREIISQGVSQAVYFNSAGRDCKAMDRSLSLKWSGLTGR